VSIDIPPKTYAELRNRAGSEHCSVKDLLLRLISIGLQDEQSGRERRIRLPIIKSQKPGSVLLDGQKIFESIDFP
jgi:hypothetical protein